MTECGKTATNLNGILFQKNQTKNCHTKMFKKNPGFINHLLIFGEMGFVLTHRQIGYKSKISDKEKEAFLDMQHSMQVTYTACMISTPRESKLVVT